MTMRSFFRINRMFILVECFKFVIRRVVGNKIIEVGGYFRV